MPVVKPKDVTGNEFVIKDKAFTDDGILFNSDFLNNLPVKDAIEKIIKVIGERKLGEKKKSDSRMLFS